MEGNVNKSVELADKLCERIKKAIGHIMDNEQKAIDTDLEKEDLLFLALIVAIFIIRKKTNLEHKAAIAQLINYMKPFAGFLPTIKGIKSACKFLNSADREVSARNNMFYDTKTNELLAEVKLKDENGNKY